LAIFSEEADISGKINDKNLLISENPLIP